MIRERLRRRDGRVHVGREAGHERRLVAEVRVRRVVGRVRDHRVVRRRARVRIQDRARVVHAGDRHLRRIAGRVRRVHFPGREVHAVVSAPLVAIDAADFITVEVAHADRQVRHAELFAELRRERVELRCHVVGHATDEVAGDVVLRIDEEAGACRHLVGQSQFLAIAQRPRGTRERRSLADAGVQAHEVRNDAGLAGARPDLGFAGEVVARVDDTEVGGRIDRVVRVVERVDRRLVGQDEDVAQAIELLGHRGDENVAHQDVLVLFLDDLVAGRNHDLDHVLARRQHRIAVIRVRDADRAVGAGQRRQGAVGKRLGRARRATGRRIAIHDARELVLAVVRRRLDLVQHRPAVEALELRAERQIVLRAARVERAVDIVLLVEPHLAALQGREEAARRVLARAVHVGHGAVIGLAGGGIDRRAGDLDVVAGAGAVSAEALGPLVEARGQR